MAYKDEYEVARLYADGRFEQRLREQFDGPVRLRFYLAPPLLTRRDPVTGEARKMQLGGYMLPAFKLLAKLKGLRGGKLDIFGYTQERRMERGLIDELEQTLDNLTRTLSDKNQKLACEIVDLIHVVRGFGHVKEKNYQQYRLRLAQQLKRYAEDLGDGTNIDSINVEIANVA